MKLVPVPAAKRQPVMPTTEAQPPAADRNPRAELSALMDGDDAALQVVCRAWRDDPEVRRDWHTYHLIGDVMRSDELAQRPSHDAAFLAALRTRLASEPVVLAPEPQPAPARRHVWLMPAAVAAGFVLVAGVLVVTRVGLPGALPQGAVLASASMPAAGGVTLVDAAGRPAQALQVEGGAAVMRDPRLDEYLRAHQAARGGVAVAAPGGSLRRVDIITMPAGARP